MNEHVKATWNSIFEYERDVFWNVQTLEASYTVHCQKPWHIYDISLALGSANYMDLEVN